MYVLAKYLTFLYPLQRMIWRQWKTGKVFLNMKCHCLGNTLESETDLKLNLRTVLRLAVVYTKKHVFIFSLTSAHSFPSLVPALLLSQTLPLSAAGQKGLSAWWVTLHLSHSLGSLFTCALHGKQKEASGTAALQCLSFKLWLLKQKHFTKCHKKQYVHNG